ncbi:MAG: hypothetical protein BWY87_00872 [Deltaproteobacteria bacterium ADurb.Bin510]|nr:MAG: hypothetical protein BWY87_00872 [Deltaproteobacteria bacterium ADurb.Bin510]
MKIDPNMTIGSVTQAATQVAGGKTGDFENLLKGLEAAGSTSVNSAMPVMSTDLLSPQRINALTTSDEALDLLSDYAAALKNPDVSLKGLASMVDQLDSMRAKVDKVALGLSSEDGLSSIMQDVSASLNAEVLRFKRGDLT